MGAGADTGTSDQLEMTRSAGAGRTRAQVLMRRFVTEWLNSNDSQASTDIMAADYAVYIGGHVLAGRPQYQSTVRSQLFERFPGVLTTVHDLVNAGDRVALRFTLHGSSAEGAQAAWRGMGLFWIADGVLSHNVTEEDYFGRRRQLTSGACDPVEPPMVAPWAQEPLEPDPAAEAVVREWLGTGQPGPGSARLVIDDARAGREASPLLSVDSTEIHELFSAGRQVAFHAVQHGTYLSGLDGLDDRVGADAELSVLGLVSVDESGVSSGHIVRDRLGLQRRMRR